MLSLGKVVKAFFSFIIKNFKCLETDAVMLDGSLLDEKNHYVRAAD